ncbi:FMN-binding protein [Micromonospora acroterricola]|uniref:FMN-binding protein n=1 Tax=Micromonospora acroterricola TaxID=2202421 RepID=A0A317DIE4_9ACTN|nr:FMN-binding protein [Micromonospora acroterricola]PWR13506.1 FMN-binding protein [Micromonospora acroterricola]
MRRAFLAITGLAASTTALVVLKGSPGTTQVAQDLPTAQAVNPTPQDADPSAAPPAPGNPAGAAPKPSVSAGAPSSPKPSRSTARPSGTRTTAKAPTAPRTTSKPPQQPTTRRVTGPGVDNEYGYVQVQIVVSGNRIVEAVSLSLPSGGESDIHSGDVRDRYNGTGGEVVQKQSANLNTVSGATETSNSYKQSLRAAIEQAF